MVVTRWYKCLVILFYILSFLCSLLCLVFFIRCRFFVIVLALVCRSIALFISRYLLCLLPFSAGGSPVFRWMPSLRLRASSPPLVYARFSSSAPAHTQKHTEQQTTKIDNALMAFGVFAPCNSRWIDFVFFGFFFFPCAFNFVGARF